MVPTRRKNDTPPATQQQPAHPARLSYTVELWSTDGRAVERIIARAASALLGRAIFAAALTEYPDRRLTLRQGKQVILDSGSRIDVNQ